MESSSAQGKLKLKLSSIKPYILLCTAIVVNNQRVSNISVG